MRLLILAAVAATLVAGFACNDSNQEPQPTATVEARPSATAEATSTIEAAAEEQPGADGFRAFAAQIEAAVEQGDTGFFRDRAVTEHVVCPEDEVSGIGGPACEFAGQEYDGFPVGYWRSEGGIVPVEGAVSFASDLVSAAMPAPEDEFGSGNPRVYAIEPGDVEAAAIITALIERPSDFGGEGPLRVARITSWKFVDSEWRFVSLLSASVLAEEFLIPCEEAVSGPWERFPDPDATGLGADACPF